MVEGLQNAFFYDSNDGDRKYSAVCFEYWLKKFFRTGVFNGDLKVIANSAMNVTVSPGYCNVDGKVRFFQEETVLSIATAGATQDRIDSIVIERNDIEREITLKVVSGDYADDPVAKTLVRSGGIYQLAIAQIRVNAGAVKITQVNIKDTRMSLELCGLVVGTVSEMDFTQLQAQFDAFYVECEEAFEKWFSEKKNVSETEFDAWFDKMKNQLGTDAAGNLQNQIEVERARINNLTKMAEGSTTGDAELQDMRIGADGTVYPTAGEAVRGQYKKLTNDFEYIPVTMTDKNLRLDMTMSIRGGYIIGTTTSNEMLEIIDSPGNAVYARNVKKGECIVFTNAFALDSRDVMCVFDVDGILRDFVYPRIIQSDYNNEYVFEYDGFVRLGFNYTAVASGEFFYLKQETLSSPLVLYANKAEEYLVDAAVGDEVIRAIMRSRNIHIRVPNADGNNYTAVYSPVLMYQLPNYMNEYVYLFFLNDGINAETGMPTFSQLKILTSHTYNMTPLI